MSTASQQKVGLQFVRVEETTVAESFTAPGQIVMNEDRTAHVGSYVDGRVTDVHATVGSVVHENEVLARLHSHSVHETRAALQSASEEQGRQQQLVEYRRHLVERLERLVALKSASKRELEQAQSDLKSAQTDLQNAHISQQKETVHLADLLRVSDSQVSHIDEQTELAPILAPINGVVVDRKITLGSIVEPGVETFTITDLGTVWMIASVAEHDMRNVRIGGRAAVTAQAYPEERFAGTITYIAPQVDPQTRTLQVRVLLQNPAGRLHPGLFANAQIAQGGSRRSLFAPEAALQDLNGGTVVFVKTDAETFRAQPVEIGQRANGRAEVLQGLRAGDAIVSTGSFVVKSELLKSQLDQ